MRLNLAPAIRRVGLAALIALTACGATPQRSPGNGQPTAAPGAPPPSATRGRLPDGTPVQAQATAGTPAAQPVATARRDSLVLQLRLPKATYLAGEGGQADVMIRNDGPTPVAIPESGRFGWAYLVLQDGQGREPAPWPWAPALRRGGASTLLTVAPHQTLSAQVSFQTPPADQATGQTYSLRATARVSPVTAQGDPDDHWQDLETEALPLTLATPGADRQLRAQLELDRAGWRLRVTGAAGEIPSGPLWGAYEIVVPSAGGAAPLPAVAGGQWAWAWDPDYRAGTSEITMRVWVAAAGYVTAAATQTLPAAGTPASR